MFSHPRGWRNQTHAHSDGLPLATYPGASPRSGIGKYGLCLPLHTLPVRSFGLCCLVTAYMAIGLLERASRANLECLPVSKPTCCLRLSIVYLREFNNSVRDGNLRVSYLHSSNSSCLSWKGNYKRCKKAFLTHLFHPCSYPVLYSEGSSPDKLGNQITKTQ